MEAKQNFPSQAGFGKMLMALLFILAGALLFARNMGFITEEWFNLLVTWHSLFIISGIYSILRRRYVFGSILLLIGVYFLGSKLMWFPDNSQALLWPLVLIFVGVLFLKPHRHKNWEHHRMHFHRKMAQKMANRKMGINEEQQCQSEDGFLYSNNSLGAVRHVVLDELFKGAKISTYFGGTTIDLRHTHIAPGETYIDVDCNWGGIELFIPSDWKVQIKCNCFCGGCEDKRWQGTHSKEDGGILIVRGNVSFGGLEIKD